jgi:hypothetical protein
VGERNKERQKGRENMGEQKRNYVTEQINIINRG